MKIDDLEMLAAMIDLQDIVTDPGDIYINPNDVMIGMGISGDLKNTFPIPDCDRCTKKCCPAGIELSILDVARFMDAGLEKSIVGTFEGYMDFARSTASVQGMKRPAPHIAAKPGVIGCRFLDRNERCGIYEVRPPVCRAFPLSLQQDEDGNMLVEWRTSCYDHVLSSDKAAFQQLFDNAVWVSNEWIRNHLLLMYARDELREMGFDKYLGSEENWLR